MIVQDYIGWPRKVNQVILEESTPKIGDNATKNDTLESGLTRGSLRNSYIPDKYSIVMDFDWEDEDISGESEYTRFIKWYKYEHKYGLKPFEFPQILYSSATGITIEDESSSSYKVEYYKITGPLDSKKRGSSMRVSMQWECVFFGTIQVPPVEEKITDLFGYQNHCDVCFSDSDSTNPVSNNFTIYIDNNPVEILGFFFSDNIAKIYYKPVSSGIHNLTFSYLSPTLSVYKGEFLTEIVV